MVKPTNQIHVAKFNRYLRELSETIKGPAFAKIIRAEAGSIMAAAAKKTKAAKISDINAKYKITKRNRKHLPEEFQERKAATKKQKEKGRKGSYKKSAKGQVKGSRVEQNPKLTNMVTLSNGKTYWTRNYYPDPIFKQIKSKLDEIRKSKKEKRMSGKATWLLIAQKARVPTRTFEDKSNLEKAIAAQKGTSFASDRVENGKQVKKTFTFHVKVESKARCALNKSARGVWALKSAMGGRERFFRRNMREGVFDRFQDEVKKYPNIYLEK